MPMKYELGRCNLQEIWKEIGWTNQKFADRMGVTRQYASDLARGEKKMGAAMIFQAADVMGVDPRRIYDLVKVPRTTGRKQRQSTESTE